MLVATARSLATRSGPPNSQVSLLPEPTIGQVMSYSPVSPSSVDDVRGNDRQTDRESKALSVSYFGNEANVAVRSHFRRQRESILFDTSSSRTESDPETPIQIDNDVATHSERISTSGKIQAASMRNKRHAGLCLCEAAQAVRQGAGAVTKRNHATNAHSVISCP